MQGLMFRPQLTLANLELKKTRTSRTKGLNKINENINDWILNGTRHEVGLDYKGDFRRDFIATFSNSKTCEISDIVCPYGGMGSELYCKETYAILSDKKVIYKVDQIGGKCLDLEGSEVRWKSPMMMPEWASRYHIILEGIGVQRIQSITPEDCMREGIDTESEAYCLAENHSNAGVNVSPPYYTFSVLWDSINHNWGSNLWSWFLYYRVKIK